jgi:peptidyl-prolyl cis-trans isomerase D
MLNNTLYTHICIIKTIIDLVKQLKALFLHLLKRVNKMSVIQTIRKNSWLMIGSIVVALIGFLLMDAFKKDGGGSRTSDGLGAVNGTEISNTEFATIEQNYVNNARAKNPKVTEAELDEAKAQAWDDLVSEKLLNTEYDKLGIQVTDKELQGMLTSQYADPMIQQNFRDPATGVFDPSKVKQYLDNLRTTKDTAQRKQWLSFEKGLIQQRLTQRYSSMLSMGTYMPKGAVEASYNERTAVASAEYVKVPYTSIDDAKVKVEDADVTAFMSKYKNAFTLEEPIRKAEYVAFDIIPTTTDTAASLGILNTGAAEFASAANTEEFIGKNSDEGFDKEYHAKGRGKSPMTDSMGNNAVGSVAGPYFEDGSFKMFKVLDKKSLPDSVRATHLLIAITKDMSETAAEAKIDSLMKTVQGGGDLAQLASQLSDDGGSKAKGGDLGYFAYGQMMPEFNEVCFMGSKGDLKKVKTNYGWHLVRVTDQKDFKPCAKIAVFAKSLKASENTMNTAYTKASQFYNGVKDKATFDAAVKKSGATKRVAEGMSQTQSTIQGLGNAREVIRWAFNKDSKVGAVSDIKSVKDGLIDKYVVACLTETAEPGLAPASMLRDRLTADIRRQKKVKMIADQYKSATSLADIASKSGQTVATADTISGSNAGTLGNEQRVIGACFNKANTSKVSEGITGSDGVYFIKVKNITPSANKPTAEQILRDQMMYQMQTSQNLGRAIPMILKKKGKVTDNRGAFM